MVRRKKHPNKKHVLTVQICFNVRPSDCAVYLMSDISVGALIMTYSRPLLRASCEVIPNAHQKVFGLIFCFTSDQHTFAVYYRLLGVSVMKF